MIVCRSFLHIFSVAALQAFRDKYDRAPTMSEDSEQLLSLKEEVALKYGVSTDLYTDAFVK